MKRILAITFLNFFIVGGLTLTIPLLLLERNVDLIEISIILSIFPLVFFIVRLLLATIADLKGWNRFYLLITWPASLFSTIIYALANSTPVFLLGKIVEAVKESSYWAVNRTTIFSLSPKQKEKEATKNIAVLSLAIAIGTATAGIGITYFGFSITLGVFVVVSAIIGIPAALLWRTPNQRSRTKTPQIKDLFDPKNRGRMFWLISFIMLFFNLSTTSLSTFILPVFMAQQLEYSYITIGIGYMLYSLISSIVTFGTLKISLGFKRVIFQSSIIVFASFFLIISNDYFLVFFFALALAEGLGAGFLESMIAKATKNNVNVSVNIGLLTIPTRFGEFSSILFFGFVAQTVGYMPIFILSGIFFSTFSVLSWYALNARDN